MWWAGNKTYDIYLGTRAFAACHGAEVLTAERTAVSEAELQSLAALRLWLAGVPSKSRLRIWLSGALCRPFVLQPVPGLKSLAELQQAAVAMVSQRTGLAGDCAVWLDKGSLETTRMAVAVSQPFLQALQEATSSMTRHRITAIRPWWSEVLRATLAQTPSLKAVAVQDCDALTVLFGNAAGEADKFTGATTLAPVTDADTAQASLARMLLAADVSENDCLFARLNLAGNPSKPMSGSGAMALFALAELGP